MTKKKATKPPLTRSEVMSRVRMKDTGPEMIVRRAAHAMGLRFRLHSNMLPGKPDLVFPSRRIALFVHGCFWHRHPGCKATRTPKSRVDFWETKFRNNVQRDSQVREELERLGWKAMIIWECEVADPEKVAEVLKRITLSPPWT